MIRALAIGLWFLAGSILGGCCVVAASTWHLPPHELDHVNYEH